MNNEIDLDNRTGKLRLISNPSKIKPYLLGRVYSLF